MLFLFEKRCIEEEENHLEILINELEVSLLSVKVAEESWISQSLAPSKSRKNCSSTMEQLIMMNTLSTLISSSTITRPKRS